MSGTTTARLLEDGRVAIYAAKAVYILSAGEIALLLPSCPSLWVAAVKRGRAYRRSMNTARREAVHWKVIP